MRFRPIALIALSTFVLAAGSAFACDKADAKAASAGSDCAAKAAAADAQVASAGSGCTAEAADAKTASAGAGCCAKEAQAASAGSACTGEKAATADAKTAGAGCHGEKAAAAMVVYDVSGMTCGGCVSKVEAAVAGLKLDAVGECTVNLEKGMAMVTVADGKEIDTDAVAQAITAAGFPAKVHPDEAEAPEAEQADETATM